MRSVIVVVGDLYLWAFVTGLLLGAGISVVTRTRIELQRRWTVFLFALSIAIVTALAGSLIGDPRGLLDRKLAYMLFGSVIVSAAGFRFPRTLGTLGLVVVMFVTVTLLTELRLWTAYVPGSEFLGFRVLSRDDEQLVVEWFPLSEGSSDRIRTTVNGSTVVLEIELLSAEPYWFFVRSYARLRTSPGDAAEARPLISRLPGWLFRVVESEPVSPNLFFPYHVTIEEGGSVEIEPRSSL